MTEPDRQTYPPLNTLKPVTDDVWIVDGPLIEFRPPLLRMPFPTRMTAIRIGGELFIHSPTPLTAELKWRSQRSAIQPGSSVPTASTTGGFQNGVMPIRMP